VAGSMLFIGGIIVLVLVREQFTRTARGGTIDEQPASQLRTLLLGSSMLAMITVMFTLRVASGAIQPIMPLYVKELANATARLATLSGLTLGVAGLTSALSSVSLGRLADRIGQRPVLIVASIAVGLLYLPQAFAQSALQLIVLQGLFGIAAGGILPSANAIVANLTPPARRGAIYGFTAAATSLGGTVGPLAGSGMTAAVDIRYVFIVSGVLMLVAAGWVIHALQPGDGDTPPAPA
jgi:MFS transporter, DHA1 family, multidrug resistance protein